MQVPGVGNHFLGGCHKRTSRPTQHRLASAACTGAPRPSTFPRTRLGRAVGLPCLAQKQGAEGRPQTQQNSPATTIISYAKLLALTGAMAVAMLLERKPAYAVAPRPDSVHTVVDASSKKGLWHRLKDTATAPVGALDRLLFPDEPIAFIGSSTASNTGLQVSQVPVAAAVAPSSTSIQAQLNSHDLSTLMSDDSAAAPSDLESSAASAQPGVRIAAALLPTSRQLTAAMSAASDRLAARLAHITEAIAPGWPAETAALGAVSRLPAELSAADASAAGFSADEAVSGREGAESVSPELARQLVRSGYAVAGLVVAVMAWQLAACVSGEGLHKRHVSTLSSKSSQAKRAPIDDAFDAPPESKPDSTPAGTASSSSSTPAAAAGGKPQQQVPVIQLGPEDKLPEGLQGKNVVGPFCLKPQQPQAPQAPAPAVIELQPGDSLPASLQGKSVVGPFCLKPQQSEQPQQAKQDPNSQGSSVGRWGFEEYLARLQQAQQAQVPEGQGSSEGRWGVEEYLASNRWVFEEYLAKLQQQQQQQAQEPEAQGLSEGRWGFEEYLASKLEEDMEFVGRFTRKPQQQQQGQPQKLPVVELGPEDDLPSELQGKNVVGPLCLLRPSLRPASHAHFSAAATAAAAATADALVAEAQGMGQAAAAAVAAAAEAPLKLMTAADAADKGDEVMQTALAAAAAAAEAATAPAAAEDSITATDTPAVSVELTQVATASTDDEPLFRVDLKVSEGPATATESPATATEAAATAATAVSDSLEGRLAAEVVREALVAESCAAAAAAAAERAQIATHLIEDAIAAHSNSHSALPVAPSASGDSVTQTADAGTGSSSTGSTSSSVQGDQGDALVTVSWEEVTCSIAAEVREAEVAAGTAADAAAAQEVPISWKQPTAKAAPSADSAEATPMPSGIGSEQVIPVSWQKQPSDAAAAAADAAFAVPVSAEKAIPVVWEKLAGSRTVVTPAIDPVAAAATAAQDIPLSWQPAAAAVNAAAAEQPGMQLSMQELADEAKAAEAAAAEAEAARAAAAAAVARVAAAKASLCQDEAQQRLVQEAKVAEAAAAEAEAARAAAAAAVARIAAAKAAASALTPSPAAAKESKGVQDTEVLVQEAKAAEAAAAEAEAARTAAAAAVARMAARKKALVRSAIESVAAAGGTDEPEAAAAATTAEPIQPPSKPVATAWTVAASAAAARASEAAFKQQQAAKPANNAWTAAAKAAAAAAARAEQSGMLQQQQRPAKPVSGAWMAAAKAAAARAAQADAKQGQQARPINNAWTAAAAAAAARMAEAQAQLQQAQQNKPANNAWTVAANAAAAGAAQAEGQQAQQAKPANNRWTAAAAAAAARAAQAAARQQQSKPVNNRWTAAAAAAAARAAQAELIAEAIAAEAAAIAAEAAAGAADSAAAAEGSAGDAAELVKGWLSSSTTPAVQPAQQGTDSSSSAKIVSGPPVSVSWLLNGQDDSEALAQLTFMAANLGHPAIGPVSSSSSDDGVTRVTPVTSDGADSDGDADAFKDEFAVPNDVNPAAAAGDTAEVPSEAKQQATLADVLDAASRQQMQAASETALQQAQARVVALYRSRRTATPSTDPSAGNTPGNIIDSSPAGADRSQKAVSKAGAGKAASSSAQQQQLACQLGVSDVALAMALAAFEAAEPSSPKLLKDSGSSSSKGNASGAEGASVTVLGSSGDPYSSMAEALSGASSSQGKASPKTPTATPANVVASDAASQGDSYDGSYDVIVSVEGAVGESSQDEDDGSYAVVLDDDDVDFRLLKAPARLQRIQRILEERRIASSGSDNKSEAAPAAAAAPKGSSSGSTGGSSKRIEVVFESLDDEADSFEVAVQRMVLNTARGRRGKTANNIVSMTPGSAASSTVSKARNAPVDPDNKTDKDSSSSNSSKGADLAPAKGDVRIEIKHSDCKADSFDVAVQRMVATTATDRAYGSSGSDSDGGSSRSPAGPSKGFGRVVRGPSRLQQQQQRARSPSPGVVGKVPLFRPSSGPNGVLRPLPWWEQRAAARRAASNWSDWEGFKAPDSSAAAADAAETAPAAAAAGAGEASKAAPAVPSPAASAAAAPTSIPVEWMSTPTDQKRAQLKERAASLLKQRQHVTAGPSPQDASQRGTPLAGPQLPAGWGSKTAPPASSVGRKGPAGKPRSWAAVTSELTQELEFEMTADGLLKAAASAAAGSASTDLNAPYATPKIAVSGQDAGAAPTKTQQLLNQQRQKLRQQRQAMQGLRGGQQGSPPQVQGKAGTRGFGIPPGKKSSKA